MSAANPARWRWVEAGVAFAIHDFQIAEHGGSDGVRDGGAIESALMRPVNLALYAEPDAADLAASYAYGLVRNHGFVDGNKRTAWVVARLWFGQPARLARRLARLAAGRRRAVPLVAQVARVRAEQLPAVQTLASSSLDHRLGSSSRR